MKMSNKKVNKQSINESLIIEDFKQASNQIENHRERILRIYILILTGIVIILPFLNKLNIEYLLLVPIIIALLIWITLNFAVSDRRLKFFSMSYLLNVSKEYDNVNYYKYICDYLYKEKSEHPKWKKIQEKVPPSILIYLFGLIVSLIALFKVILSIIQIFKDISVCYLIFYIFIGLMYLFILGFLNYLICGKLCSLYKNKFEKVDNDVKQLIDNYNKKKK